MRTALAITGIGMVTPVGASAAATAEALARVDRATPETDGARLALDVPPNGSTFDRALGLSQPALADCLSGAERHASDPTGLLLCVPEVEPARFPASLFGRQGPSSERHGQTWADLITDLASEVETEHGARVRSLDVFRSGHAAGMSALMRAADLLESRLVRRVLVGGVDTSALRGFYGRDTIGRLTQNRTTDGIPGEAAVFLCLRHALDARHAVTIAACTHTPRADDVVSAPAFAEALTRTTTRALTAWEDDPRRITTLFADLQGERDRAQGALPLVLRALWRTAPHPRVLYPIDRMGNVGAASALLLTALAAQGLAAETHKAALVLCGSSLGGKGTALLTAPRAISASRMRPVVGSEIQ